MVSSAMITGIILRFKYRQTAQLLALFQMKYKKTRSFGACTIYESLKCILLSGEVRLLE